MKKISFLLSLLALIACSENPVHFNVSNNPIVSDSPKIVCNSTIIDKKSFKACQSGDINLFVLNENNDTIYKHSSWTNGVDFIDFNEDGHKDILFHYITNVPFNDLALYNKSTANFKLVDKFDEYPEPIKITGTDYYYSYHRSGCSDLNWDSDLFYIKDYKCYKIGNIHGIGCEGEEKNGIFIFKVKNDHEELIESISRKAGYYKDKWEFIEAYWSKNFHNFSK